MANILVVDDDNVIREMLMEILCDNGHKVMEAPNGKIAENMIFTQEFDLVISDINMPEMDGLQLVERVKFANPKTKFIFMTGYHKPENIEFCLHNNISRYIQKPFKIKEILDKVSETLEEKNVESVLQTKSMTKQWIEIELYSTEESLMRVRHYLQQYLEQYIPIYIIKRITLPIYEMLKNAIEWGNKFSKEKIASIACLVLSDRIVFKIQDEGKGFNVKEALNPIKDPFERQDARQQAGKRPGGYGIEITSKSVDEFFYNENGNCVIMTIMIPRT